MNRMQVLAAVALVAAGPDALAQPAIGPKGTSFPITITQPGSYKLTGNLVVPAGTAGIIVNAREATIEDLTVAHNTDYGIVGGSSTYPTVANRVRARPNKLGGFQVSGMTLADCVAAQNGQYGFYVVASALIDSVSAHNLGTGVLAPAMVGLRGVRAYGNDGGNFVGNYVSAGGNMNEWMQF